MALISKLGTTKVVNPAGNRIILTDITGNIGDKTYEPSDTAEGLYDEIINDSGYGAPNALRSELAVFVIGFQKKVAGDVRVEFESYNPMAATEFLAKAPEDAWYKFHLITVPIVTDTTDIEEGGFGYFEGTIIGREEGELLNHEAWDLVDTTYMSAPVEQFFVANNSTKLNQANQAMIDVYRGPQDNTATAKLTRIKGQFDTIKVMLSGSIYEYCRANKYTAQANIEYLNNYITDLNYGVI